MTEQPRIAVIGLGYVGLPLAVALSRHFPTLGLDIDGGRIAELRRGHDRTGEFSPGDLADGDLVLEQDPVAARGRDIFIITVPTPVDARNRPDLRALKIASQNVASCLTPGALVVYESTVFPGCTEDICAPILERESGLVAGRDFHLGYSPERICPGDKSHGIHNITKVVAGQTPEITARLAKIYGVLNGGDIFAARDIRTAEASKVIENAQRDINIAFMNEIADIFGRMGLSTYDVLEAAGTKWNFQTFWPGLVGGHCIGVDPYYLAHAARRVGVTPEVILAGRRINNLMARSIAARVSARLPEAAKLLALGVTFKENVPDIRNSKAVDLIRELESLGHDVSVHDPHADPAEARSEYGIALMTPDFDQTYDAVIGAVRHREFIDLPLQKLLRPGGLVADIKAIWRARTLPDGFAYWTL